MTQERQVLVEHLLEHVCCEDETMAREIAEAVADRVLRSREAYERVRALDVMLGLDDMLRDL